MDGQLSGNYTAAESVVCSVYGKECPMAEMIREVYYLARHHS